MIDEKQMCTRKIRYASEFQAHAGIGKMRFKYGMDNYYRTYQCPVCGGWHVTKQANDDYARRMKLLIET